MDYNASILKQELADKVGQAITAFTLTKTKEQLYNEGAFERQILVASVSSTKDITEDIQLGARDFWQNIHHPELGTDITYCGQFAPMTETPIQFKMRAPLIGEHNPEIYIKELGMTESDIDKLKAEVII